MVGNKGQGTTLRSSCNAVSEVKSSSYGKSSTGFASDNTGTGYNLRRKAEERRTERIQELHSRDSKRPSKSPKGIGMMRTSKGKDLKTPSSRIGIIGSAPTDERISRKCKSAREREIGTYSKESFAKRRYSTNNKLKSKIQTESSRSPSIKTKKQPSRISPSIVTHKGNTAKSMSPVMSPENGKKKPSLGLEKSELCHTQDCTNKKMDGSVAGSDEQTAHSVVSLGKIIQTKSAGVSSDARRAQKDQMTNKSRPQVSPFSAIADTPIIEKSQESPKISSKITASQTSSLKSQTSRESVTFWSKIQSSHSGDGQFTPTLQYSTSGNTTEEEKPMSIEYSKSPKCFNKGVMDNGKGDKSSTSSAHKAIDWSFTKSFGRKKSKNLDNVSPRSDNDTDISSTKPKKSTAISKLMRILGKTLSKRLLLADDSKTGSLKHTLRRTFGSRKSTSSNDASDTSSSLDIEEIKALDQDLYTTILETVASWCEDPIAEPDGKSDDAVSARSFSSISFRGNTTREKSQDLTNFNIPATLDDAVEASVIDASEKEENTESDDKKDRDSERLKNVRSEVANILNSLDKCCKRSDGKSVKQWQVIANSSEKSIKSQPIPSFLELADSDSDEDNEVLKKKMKSNSFLHLTSSEVESFQVKGIKELLKMQGIWLFDWDQCSEMKELPREWLHSCSLMKYLSGCRGIELSMEDRMMKCFLYPSETYEYPLERIYLDAMPKSYDNKKTRHVKGTLTTVGFRTTFAFAEDNSKREELFCLEKCKLCIQVCTELSNGKTNVSRVFLKRPS